MEEEKKKNAAGKKVEIPAGYRFQPRDEELVDFYLRNKINNLPMDPRFNYPITENDISTLSPDELLEKHELGKDGEWYFFTPRYKKYPKGTRPDRRAQGGSWKPTGAKFPVRNIPKTDVIGYKRSLTFQEDTEDPKQSQKSDWLMIEYKLEKHTTPLPKSNKLDEWVIVKIYKKRGSDKEKKVGCPSKRAIPLDKEKKKQKVEVDECGPSKLPNDATNPYYGAQAQQVGVGRMQNQAPKPLFPRPISTMPPLQSNIPFYPETHFTSMGPPRYANPHGNQAHPTYALIGETQSQASNPANYFPGGTSEAQYFGNTGMYYDPYNGFYYYNNPHLNQMHQASGPPPPHQMPFGLNVAEKQYSSPNVGQSNSKPGLENGFQSQQFVGECSSSQAGAGGSQFGGYSETQIGECSSSQTGVGGDWQFDDMGFEEDDFKSLMDQLLADEDGSKLLAP